MDTALEAHGDPNASGPDVQQCFPESVIPPKSAPSDDIINPYLDHPVMPSLPPISPNPTCPPTTDEHKLIINPEVPNDGKSLLQQNPTPPGVPPRNYAIVDSLDNNKKIGPTEKLKWAPGRKHVDVDDEAGGTEDENAGGTEDETELEDNIFKNLTSISKTLIH